MKAELPDFSPRKVLTVAALGAAIGCQSPSSAPAEAISSASVKQTATAREAPADSEQAKMLRSRLVNSIRSSDSWDSEGKWDERVLDTMLQVPRHQFAPGLSLAHAYDDRPMPIGFDQTISQPTIVAIMTQALGLAGNERVLEIGTGSGYQAAVLSKLARDVYSIEIVESLGTAAAARLGELGYLNVHVRVGDGYAGWPEHAPFDRIILTAAPPEVPAALIAQLAEGGILVAPVGDLAAQALLRLRKQEGKVTSETLGPVRFVPMVPGK